MINNGILFHNLLQELFYHGESGQRRRKKDRIVRGKDEKWTEKGQDILFRSKSRQMGHILRYVLRLKYRTLSSKRPMYKSFYMRALAREFTVR